MKNANRYDEICHLLNIPNNDDSALLDNPKKVAFNTDEEKQLYFELINLSEKDKEYFPEDFRVAAVKNIVITAENPLVINESDPPIAYHFDTMTFKEGGQILCHTSALITVETLIK